MGMHAGCKDDAECAVCHCYLHLSAVECKCCPKRYVCLRHADSLCECPASSWRLAYRHSLGELEHIVTGLRARVPPGTGHLLALILCSKTIRDGCALLECEAY